MARNYQRISLLLLLLLSSSYPFIVEATQQIEITIESRFAELLQRVSKQDTKISEIESRGKEKNIEISILKLQEVKTRRTELFSKSCMSVYA